MDGTPLQLVDSVHGHAVCGQTAQTIKGFGGKNQRMTAAQTGDGPVAEVFSPERLDQMRAGNKPVFVNLTAAWCITCLVNEQVALSSKTVADAFRDKGVAYLKGDWTNRDPVITRVLEAYARRLQVQERLTAEVADCIWNNLHPLGVAVVIEAQHGCMTGRGVRTQGVEMKTSRMMGVFRDDERSRKEVLQLMGY